MSSRTWGDRRPARLKCPFELRGRDHVFAPLLGNLPLLCYRAFMAQAHTDGATLPPSPPTLSGRGAALVRSARSMRSSASAANCPAVIA